MSDQLNLKASWPEVKERLKEINIQLADEDLVYEPGQENVLFDRLATKMNRSPEDIKAWIESVSANKGKAS